MCLSRWQSHRGTLSSPTMPPSRDPWLSSERRWADQGPASHPSRCHVPLRFFWPWVALPNTQTSLQTCFWPMAWGPHRGLRSRLGLWEEGA